ncbi:MAG: hypothetical protein NZ561_00115 [Phycisphaerae bacterium]|nr:hypothetical protein [Phycisphaerae bacterium]MDW8263029.1 hypothetical protein [Phycisphaerales bacterium]
MKTWTTAGLALLLAIGCQNESVKVTKAPEQLREERTETIVATVKAIDHQTRDVTLQTPDGQDVSVRASELVRNLDQVKVGDKVKVTHYQSKAIRLRQPGDTATETELMTDRAPEGEKPAAFARESKTVVARILKIDRAAPSVTVKTNEGKTITATVSDRKNLDKVKVGDELTITYVEGYAIAVEGAE